MAEPLSPTKLKLHSRHKWTGVSVFLLVWLRLAWRVTHRLADEFGQGSRRWEFGIPPIPDLLAKDKQQGNLLHGIHENLNLQFIAAGLPLANGSFSLKRADFAIG